MNDETIPENYYYKNQSNGEGHLIDIIPSRDNDDDVSDKSHPSR